MADTNQTNKPKGSFDLFKPSMEAVNLNFWTFFWLAYLPALLFVGGSMADSDKSKLATSSWQLNTAQTVALGGTVVIFVLLAVAVALIVAPALIHLELQSARGKKVSVSGALRVGLRYFTRYLGLMLLYGLLVLGGLLLFIIPGLIMIRRYFLAPYYLIDKDLSIRKAMRQSAAATKPHSGSIWGIIGVNVLLSIPSFVPIIGQIISAILSTLYSVAPALRYDEIRQPSSSSETK